ncbi:MAG: hypothetical protein ACRCWO_11250 [Bosea sp. (in: a-proteobacteria)]
MSNPDEDRAAEAKAALERVRRDSETLGGSTMARAAGDKAKGWADHFVAKDAVGQGEQGETDAAELWGRRIGRGLSLIGVIVLTYLLGQQLKLW